MREEIRHVLHRFFAVLAGLLTAGSAGNSDAEQPQTNDTALQTAIVSGDCNGDGLCNEADIETMLAFFSGEAETVSPGADLDGDGYITTGDLAILRERLTVSVPENPSVTVMVYFSGAELESDYSEATEDLKELAAAQYSDRFHVVAMTGGSAQWHSEYAAADGNYRVTFGTDGVRSVKMDGGIRDMAAPETLSAFIRETAAAYPADRYALVLWGHGAGPVFGVCYDECSGHTMFLPYLQSALQQGGVHFDMIGFDCCYMGNAETGYAVRDYADYMVASPAVLNRFGLEYSRFVSAWSAHPVISSQQVCAELIGSTEAVCRQENIPVSAACYDLHRMDELMQCYAAYISDVYSLYSRNGIESIITQRKAALDYEMPGFHSYDTVDLADLTAQIETAHSEALQALLKQTVIIRKTWNLPEDCGISVWFAEQSPVDGIDRMPAVFRQIGLDPAFVTQMQEMSKTAGEVSGAGAEQLRERAQLDAAIAEFNWE